MLQVADVVVFLPLDGPLTYLVPESFVSKIKVGMRAVVPVRNVLEVGIVVRISTVENVQEGREEGWKEIVNLPDEEPCISKELIDLCFWVSDYYVCPPGLVFPLALVPTLRKLGKTKYTINTDAVFGFLPGTNQYRIIEAMGQDALSLQELRKRVKMSSKELEKELMLLIREGVIKVVYEPYTEKEKQKTEDWVRLKRDGEFNVGEVLQYEARYPKQVKAYLYLLHQGKEFLLKELIKDLGVSRAVLQSMEKKGWIEIVKRETSRVPKSVSFSELIDENANIVLTYEQSVAIERITQEIGQERFKVFLLHGVTGSGKTEVYMRCIEYAMRLGYQALVLVPEISLTHQAVGRLHKRFGEGVAILHSNLSEGERIDEWRRVREGRAKVVVGVRSAVFAPFQRLGLIIVDEEHEHTYKQEEMPMYQARDVAVMRAKFNSAICVLGSATPSLESYYHSMEGKYDRLALTQRVASGTLPEIHIVDLRKETADPYVGETIISSLLSDKIRERLEKKEQVILLVNRRGFSPVVMCPSCGWVVPCPNCYTSLNYHRYDGQVHCHYCDYRAPRPVQCRECGSVPLIMLGSGTQRVEDLLIQNFPDAMIARIDTDIASKKEGSYHILRSFSERSIDILIGTQMVAKGHDYPFVTLVGVINADIGFNLPNFRATEYAFQLLMQVAGRSGRRERPGEVIIQTLMPNHYILTAVKNHSYEMFVQNTLKHRKTVGYPPYRRMIRFGVESPDENEVKEMVYLTARYARENILPHVRDTSLIGPAPAVLRKVRGQYRWQFAILGKSVGTMNRIAKTIVQYFEEHKVHSRILLRVDVDPYEIY